MTKSISEMLAEGTVAFIDGANVTFMWQRAVAQRNGGAWRLVDSPAATLQRQEESRHDYEGGGRNQNFRRRAQSSRGRVAVQRDSHRIRAPEAAWALLRKHRPIFVATLVSSEVQPDEQLALLFTTVGGEEIRATIAQNSSVSAVAALLREQRGLDVDVQIISTCGAMLDPQADVHVSCL